jgi:hypothetical protein
MQEIGNQNMQNDNDKEKLVKIIQKVNESIGDLGGNASNAITQQSTSSAVTSVFDIIVKILSNKTGLTMSKMLDFLKKFNIDNPKNAAELVDRLPSMLNKSTNTKKDSKYSVLVTKSTDAADDVSVDDESFDDESFDDESADDIGRIKIGSSNIDTDVVSRVNYVSKTTGVKPAAIYGIEQAESASDPSAMAFNGHAFRRNLDTQEEIDLANQAGFVAKENSYYGTNAKKQFKIAYKINPVAAIKGAAWGRYQVLGETSLSLYGNSPKRFLSAFYGNPVDHSTRSLIAWIDAAGGKFVDAINSGKDVKWIKMYYGPAAFKSKRGEDYLKRYRSGKSKWKRASGHVA